MPSLRKNDVRWKMLGRAMRRKKSGEGKGLSIEKSTSLWYGVLRIYGNMCV